ncbi:MAG: hypothetical protein ACI89U_003185 [Gammaproteobacteria bacterium]
MVVSVFAISLRQAPLTATVMTSSLFQRVTMKIFSQLVNDAV